MDASQSIAMLQRRAEMLATARAFFSARGVLEVCTPILGDGLVVEANIDPIPCRVRLGAGAAVERHLLASPEGPMKRLLAAGSGPIYQFAHAFRDGEVGDRHAVEFTMLEWYRPGFDHHQLMDEVEALVFAWLGGVASSDPFDRQTYQQVFIEHANIDPFATTLGELRTACERFDVPVPDSFAQGTLDDALDLLLVAHIEPQLGKQRPLFVTDYPASQAALAKVRKNTTGHKVADRFELYIAGIELANGYHELTDPTEQRHRFEQANEARRTSGRPELPIDEPLLEALADGFPDCAGVALGFDRMLMLATNTHNIRANWAY